jgi:hypothetical protein
VLTAPSSAHFLKGTIMKANPNQRRLARLQRECDVSVAPVLLLFAACAVTALILKLGLVLDETAPVRAEEPTEQTTPPVS